MPDPICTPDTSKTVPTYDCEPFEINNKVTRLEAPPPSRLEVFMERGDECFSEVDAVAILVAGGSKSPELGFLAGLKAGTDLADCLDSLVLESQAEVVTRARDTLTEECLSEGGVVAGWVGGADDLLRGGGAVKTIYVVLLALVGGVVLMFGPVVLGFVIGFAQSWSHRPPHKTRVVRMERVYVKPVASSLTPPAAGAEGPMP